MELKFSKFRMFLISNIMTLAVLALMHTVLSIPAKVDTAVMMTVIFVVCNSIFILLKDYSIYDVKIDSEKITGPGLINNCKPVHRIEISLKDIDILKSKKRKFFDKIRGDFVIYSGSKEIIFYSLFIGYFKSKEIYQSLVNQSAETESL